MKRPTKKNGVYEINGKKYSELIGKRAKVWHGTAYKTAGGLTKNDLMMNKHGRIVSKKKHNTAKKEKRLEKAGYKTKKGVFGSIKKGPTKRKSRKSRKSKKQGSKKR
tara:strand:+ start:1365 stop:1685 length:321 start_codon:yes stop_codon:yes gene_type:complete